ncbi:SDR family NAD(P)-dependent oxidoreductase [Bordetella sp. 2513F-2]
MAKRVAIVGMSFRFPSTDARSYWNDLLTGKDLVTEVAPDRWSTDAYLHPSKDHPGTAYTFAAGSVGDISGFDADFFGISPREAALMDPQQRMLLELAWEAIESAGIKPSSLRGSNCGVYVGIASADYAYRLSDDFNAVEASFATGNTSSVAANRLSYVFDLHGPSMALDTACSSALVAFHQACRAIISGEIPQALAGGISLHAHPYGFITFSKATMLSPHGRCQVFDAAGDGYVRSEGGGLFLLKDYDQALADGDPILAVVAGSAVNTDGRKSGLTVPNVDAQVALMRQAYAEAGISPAEIDYLEAHGTGTSVGDPIEARAIGLALGQPRGPGAPLPIGSVKSNMGHLETASGVAGLVKAIMALRHRTVPATIGIRKLNPNIDFEDWNIEVVRQPRPLRPTGTLTVGVNSFGFGGANAHVILRTPPAPSAGVPDNLASTTPLPVVVTGRTAAALRDAARDLARFLREQPPRALYDVAYQAAMRREWHPERAVVYGADAASIAEALQEWADQSVPKYRVATATRVPDAQGPVLVYSGNGSQWPGMGRQLMGDAVFAEAVHEIDSAFMPLAGFKLADTLLGDEAGIYARTEIAQPALFAVQVGITRMLAQRGIRPAAVVGHSVGEVAAAWACGALRLADAVAVIFHRSRLQGTTRGQGRMAALGVDGASAAALLAELGLESRLCVAGYNSVRGSTLAGDPAALAEAGKVLAERKVFFRELDLDYAFHSPAMDPIEAPLLQSLAGLQPRSADIPFYSAVTGAALDGTALDASYWWRNIRLPVRFEQALEALVADGHNVYAEVGPHPILRGYVNDALKQADKPGMVATTATRGNDEPARVRDAAGQLLLSGAEVDWKFLFPWAGRHVALPAYPWQRERHWHPVTAESQGLLERRRVHPLLGYPLRQHEATWENQVDTHLQPWVADHVVGDAIVFPGAGFVEIALAASQQLQPGECAEFEELEVRTPLLAGPAPSKLIRISVDPADGRCAIKSKEVGSTDPWTPHAVGRLLSEPGPRLLGEPAPELPQREPDFNGEAHLALTNSVGLAYGPAFQTVAHGWMESPTSVLAVLQPQDCATDPAGAMLLHPTLLDAAFQLVVHMLKDDPAMGLGIAFVPTRIGRLAWRSGLGLPHTVRARLLRRAPHSLTAEFALFDAEGRQVVAVREARFRGVRLSKAATDHLDFLDYVGVPAPHPHAAASVPVELKAPAVRAALERVAAEAARVGLLSRYTDEVDPLLESLCDRYALRALSALAQDGHLAHSAVQTCRETLPETAALLDLLIARAERAGDLAPEAEGWRLAAPAEDEPDVADIWNSLLREYPDDFAIVHAVGRTGLHLHDMLLGGKTFAEVCPRDATPAALARQAMGEEAAQRLADALRDQLQQALRMRAPGQRLAVLEIGADAPLFAPEFCAALDFDVCDYAYASTQADALEAAQRLVEQYPDMQVAEIGAEPAAAPARADLVVLHADFPTPQAAQLALHHARAALKPGGTLLLRGTHPAAWMDFVFGGQSAWWQDDAAQGRLSCQYPAAAWQALLAQQGLDCGEPLNLAAGGQASGPYLLAATAPEATETAEAAKAPATPASAPGGWLLLADAAGPGRALADALAQALGADRALVRDDATPDTLDALLAHASQTLGTLHGIVHLQGLAQGAESAGSAESAEPQDLLAIQVARCALAAGLAQACERAGLKPMLWLCTAGAAQHLPDTPAAVPAGACALNDAALWNYGRTLMNEAAGFGVRLLDLPLQAPAPLDALVRELQAPDAEQEIVLGAGGERYAPRLRTQPHPGTAAASASADDTPRVAQLGFDFPGQLRNLRWQSRPCPALAPGQVQVRVHATGLNFRDVMYALGLLSDEAIENGFAGPTLGMEFAGTIERVGADVEGLQPGDAVVGFGPASFADRVLTQSGAVSAIPPGMSFEAAATIPSTFFTVYYALHHLARLEPGEHVLIHGAAGGVGIAAIQYAQWRGAEIHATAGSDEKRDFLRLMGVTRIYDSRSLSYADEILASTGGRGVDVVLNSLAGEAINRNLRVLKPFGRFLELGKRDFYENTRIGLRPFRNNISYFGIDADQLMSERPDLTRRLFAEVMDLFREGALRPLPYQAFDANEVVDAFRYMQQARQIGKIVVTYRNGVRTAHPAARPAGALQLPEAASYLVTGGLSGFGLRTAEWLADKGARHLVLLSRSGPATDAAQEALARLQARGVAVHAAACDVTDRAALGQVLEHVAAYMPPLRGIVHAAMVIDDGLIRGADAAQIERVLAPKVLGAMHLDVLTQGMPLDFFVAYSSGTTLFGNPGQANYVAANGWLEAWARQRRAQGLPATCVRWGAIDDVGYLARNKKIKDALQSRMGGAALPAGAALDVLEQMLLSDASDLGVLELDWRALARFLPTADTPKFSWVARRAGSSEHDDAGGADIAHLLATLDDAALLPMIADMLKHEVGEILRVPAEKIDPERSIYDMGLDSLMGVELIVALENRFGIKLPVMALNESPTIARLSAKLLELLRGDEGSHADPVAAQVAQVVAQHADEVSSDAVARFTDEIKSGDAASRQRMIQ